MKVYIYQYVNGEGNSVVEAFSSQRSRDVHAAAVRRTHDSEYDLDEDMWTNEVKPTKRGIIDWFNFNANR